MFAIRLVGRGLARLKALPSRHRLSLRSAVSRLARRVAMMAVARDASKAGMGRPNPSETSTGLLARVRVGRGRLKRLGLADRSDLTWGRAADGRVPDADGRSVVDLPGGRQALVQHVGGRLVPLYIRRSKARVARGGGDQARERRRVFTAEMVRGLKR